MALPELRIDQAQHRLLLNACFRAGGIDHLEERILAQEFADAELFNDPQWTAFAESTTGLWKAMDYVVVRGLPVTPDGTSIVLAALVFSSDFRTYRRSQVVKKFSMSPWTKGLSHTTRRGDFHTDLNTDPEPPALTAIQCLEPDPGAPHYGENRVARLIDLLRYFEDRKQTAVLRFLRESQITMTNGRLQSWSGHVVAGDHLRYHPATLRAAEQNPAVAAQLEEMIAAVHQAALAVSTPFHLNSGDILFVSNHRALHYRGECSVAFTRYPTEYRARSIFVLHQMSEPR
jgi:hypothetical protein